MARWLVEIVGEPAVVYRYIAAFGSGDPSVETSDDRALITGSVISTATTPTDAGRLAQVELKRLGGILSLLEGSARPVGTGTVWFEDDDGKRTGHALLAVEFRATLEAGAQPARAQRLLAATKQHPLLLEALELWAVEPQTWSTLYKVFEALQGHTGGLVSAGMLTKGRQERFKRSAQSPASAGLESRHSSARSAPPTQPIVFNEARELVRRLLTRVLESASQTNQMPK